jgi:hypothetical protein
MGMTFNQITTQVGQFIQDSSSGRETRIKDSINRKYQELADGFDWPDLLRLRQAEVTINANEAFAFLPYNVDVVKKIVVDDKKDLLVQTNPEMFLNRFYDTLDTAGQPFSYTMVGSSPVKRVISSAEQLDFVSSDATDTSQVVEVWGFVGGEEINESVTLNGTTTVTTANSFSRVTRIGTDSSSKDSSRAGHITVTGNTSSTEYAVITVQNNDARYQAIRFQDIPSATTTLTSVYKKKVEPLINDGDTLEIPCDLILFELAAADILRQQAKYNQANVHEQLAARLRQEMMSRYFMQTEAVFQSAPHGPGNRNRNMYDLWNRRVSVVN